MFWRSVIYHRRPRSNATKRILLYIGTFNQVDRIASKNPISYPLLIQRPFTIISAKGNLVHTVPTTIYPNECLVLTNHPPLRVYSLLCLFILCNKVATCNFLLYEGQITWSRFHCISALASRVSAKGDI